MPFVLIQTDYRERKNCCMVGPFNDRIAAFAFACQEALDQAEQYEKVLPVQVGSVEEWNVCVFSVEHEKTKEWSITEMISPPRHMRNIKHVDCTQHGPMSAKVNYPQTE